MFINIRLRNNYLISGFDYFSDIDQVSSAIDTSKLVNAIARISEANNDNRKASNISHNSR